MPLLFEPFRIGSMDIANRFMRSATTSYWSDKRGIVRPEIIDLYRRLAQGGVGLIVKGHLYVKDSGKAHVGMAGISHDYHIPKLKKLTDEVHRNGGKIIAQLNHGGMYSLVDSAGPSENAAGLKARSLSPGEIHEIVDAFGEAADRALAAGFDGVQIHGAHGYLISQFLSRLVNRRKDEWGGTLEKRMRLLLEVYDCIRARVGSRTPVMLRINCDDFSPKGFTVKDSSKVTKTICTRGLQLVEISGGGIGSQKMLRIKARSTDRDLSEASFAGHARIIRKVTYPTPMALVNGIRSVRCMEAILNKNLADIVSMSRPFIRDPNLVKKLEAGQGASTCTSCSKCNSEEVFGKMMLRCHVEKTQAK
jgi:2,4-dienoyl-CoA reductase-like NADH-dependent reductase (Old Yellow Enzyme family)